MKLNTISSMAQLNDTSVENFWWTTRQRIYKVEQEVWFYNPDQMLRWSVFNRKLTERENLSFWHTLTCQACVLLHSLTPSLQNAFRHLVVAGILQSRSRTRNYHVIAYIFLVPAFLRRVTLKHQHLIDRLLQESDTRSERLKNQFHQDTRPSTNCPWTRYAHHKS